MSQIQVLRRSIDDIDDEEENLDAPNKILRKTAM